MHSVGRIIIMRGVITSSCCVPAACCPCPAQALTKQVTDTVSLQSRIEAQQATIDGLQDELAQLSQLKASQEELCTTLEEGNQQLREQLELEQTLHKQTAKASEVCKLLRG